MKRAPLTATLFVILLAVLAVPALAQTSPVQPVISSVQASILCEVCTPMNVQGVTIGTASDILIYLNGTFDPNTQPSVYWTDAYNNSGAPISLEVYSFDTANTPNQITVYVPATYFETALGPERRVQITVQQGNLSATTPFGLNSPMRLIPSLPVGTTGVSYSAPIITGGTAPFTVTLANGTVPTNLGFAGCPIQPTPLPGLNQTTECLAGLPTTAGGFTFTPTVTDTWGNFLPPAGTVGQSLYVQIVAPAVVSSVSPNVIPAGSGYMPITVTGSNFTNGSAISWTVNNVQTFLANTTYVSPTQLTAYVPTSKMASPASVSIGVLQPNDITYGNVPLTIAAPVVSTLSPNHVTMGATGFTLTVSGAYFASRVGAPDVRTGPYIPTVQFGNSYLTTTLVNSSTLTAAVPANLVASAATIPVSVVNPGGSTSGTVNFQVFAPLTIITTALSPGTAGTPYAAQVTATGGAATYGYSWTFNGLPSGLTGNSSTGSITGTPLTAGNYPVSIRVTDSYGTSAQTSLTLTINPAPPTVNPGNLPEGTVGVSYAASITATGNGPFTFALTTGSLPDGLRMDSNGSITGTPTRAGTFNFGVIASTSVAASTSQGFSIVIHPSQLILADPSTTLTAGTAATITLSATGGLQPYTFSLTCTLPGGLSLSGAVISGTPTTPGTTTCHLTVTDSTGATASRNFTITVLPQPLTFAGGALPDGKVGVAYSAQLPGAGGTAPLKYTASGIPDGLSLSGSGAITGTPTTPGQFSISATVTDSAPQPASITATFTVKIAPAVLTIATASLPDGIAGSPYSASITATGGVRPYTFTITGLPGGVTSTSAGAISGTPNAPGTFTVNAGVKDATGTTASATLTVKISTTSIVFSISSLPGGTVGTAYGIALAATGGNGTLSWSATGLPGGLNISSGGVITGTPTVPGTFNVSVTVKDAAGATASKGYTITVTLPSTPNFNFGGTGGTASPMQQPQLAVSLDNPFPADITVTLTLTFAPDSGPDDPSIQFSTGGRTAQITIPAGSTAGATSVGVQTGTVAGLITITTNLQSDGVDITPSPVPTQTIRIDGTVPVISQVTATRTSTGFTVTVTGYAPTRKITQAIFQFTAAAGTTLSTSSITVPVDSLFSPYFASTTAGSQFIYTQPFTVSGNLQGITSVNVTLVSDKGNSTTVTATVN